MDEQRLVYVGLSRHKNGWAIVSLLIRWWESPKSRNPLTWFNLFHSSHVFMIFPANNRRSFYMVSEAAGESVRFMSQMNFEGHAEIVKVYELKFSKPIYDKIKTYSEQYAGTPYAFLENVGIVFSKIFHRKRNPFSDGEKSQKCSELVLRNAILRLPGMNYEALRTISFDARAIQLPEDLDLVGVRETYELLECLSDAGKIARVPQYWPLKVN